MKHTLRALTILLITALILSVVRPVLAQGSDEQEMSPDQVIKAMYEAVVAQDLDTAGKYLAEDVVLVLGPPPPGTDGTFVGKEAVLGWYEDLIKNNVAIELSNAEVSGDRVTLTNLTWVDDLPVVPIESDGTGIVQDGLVKTISWFMTPESIAELDAAFAKLAKEQVVRRILQEIWSEGNLDLVDELVAEDYVSHSFPVLEGREAFKQDIVGFREHFPGATIVVDSIVFDGNRAIILSRLVGPDGSLDEPPPEDYIEDVLIYQIENGQLTDRWYFAPVEP